MLALTSSEWDITDAPAAERFIEPGDVVINCAAYTKVDAAESDEARAHAVNAVGTRQYRARLRPCRSRIHPHLHRLRLLRLQRARPYEIDDETGPQGVYGRTKLAGEFARARGDARRAHRPNGVDLRGR